jgi:ATP-dependent DNA ligase
MLSPYLPTGFIEPCLPTPSRTVPIGPGWADGYRFIARRDGERVRVFSRHGKDWTDKVPLIVEALLALPVSGGVFSRSCEQRQSDRHGAREIG